jgi:hypothetical protein
MVLQAKRIVWIVLIPLALGSAGIGLAASDPDAPPALPGATADAGGGLAASTDPAQEPTWQIPRLRDPWARIVSCDWYCPSSFCSGFCTGEASGSEPPFSGLWKVDRTGGLADCIAADDGVWQAQCPCDRSRGETVIFTVTDSLGRTDTDTLLCGN